MFFSLGAAQTMLAARSLKSFVSILARPAGESPRFISSSHGIANHCLAVYIRGETRKVPVSGLPLQQGILCGLNALRADCVSWQNQS
jgi:hypothetical protein